MNSHKLSTVVYAQGWLDTEINEKYGSPEPDQQEHFDNVLHMWQIVFEGLDQLRKENASLQNKLTLIDLARSTET